MTKTNTVQILNKCPNCGSELSFNPKTGVLCCAHCDTMCTISSLSIGNSKRTYSDNIVYKPELIRTQQYKCSQCGNTHSLVSETPLKRCPSCGSTALTKSVDISIKPDGIVPFKIDRDDAASAFSYWIKKRKFAPNNLKKLAKNKKLSASYCPVWNFDYTCQFSYSGIGEICHTDSKGNTHCSRHAFSSVDTVQGQNFFESASSSLGGEIFRKLGDFDLTNTRVFSPEYTYGWSCRISDIDLHPAYAAMTNDAHKIHVDNIMSQLNFKYDNIYNFQARSYFDSSKYNYIYLPIWANYYSYKEKNYYCYINGTNGQATGKAPKSFWKIFFLILGIVAAACAIAYIIKTLN